MVVFIETPVQDEHFVSKLVALPFVVESLRQKFHLNGKGEFVVGLVEGFDTIEFLVVLSQVSELFELFLDEDWAGNSTGEILAESGFAGGDVAAYDTNEITFWCFASFVKMSI